MKRRTIKVGGGVWHTDHMGTVILRSRSGKEVIIEQVYHVPGLGANLLSCRKLCMLGLKGNFDIDSTYLQLNGIDVLKADHKEGVYELTWISKNFPSGFVRMDNISKRVIPVYESAQATVEPSAQSSRYGTIHVPQEGCC